MAIGSPGLAATPDSVNDTGWAPPGNWPDHTKLAYIKDLVTVGLLLLAIPWVLSELVRRPGRVLEAAGKHHVGKGA